MNVRKTTIPILAVLLGVLLGGPALAGTARQYRGPADEAPRGLLPPGPEGPFGTSRLVSRSRQVEGESRWEYWWEVNRDRFLRAATARRSVAAGDGMMQAFSETRPGVADVTAEDVANRIVPALLGRLVSRDAEERALAAVALGKTGSPSAFGPLRVMLKDGEPTDRRAAAVALGLLGEPLAVPVLAEYLGRRGVSPAERAYAALGLGLLGSEGAAPVLKTALAKALGQPGRELAEFQAAAATALGLIRDRSAVPTLVRVIDSKRNRSEEVRAAAVLALGRIGDEAALATLLRALSDNQVEVRRASAQALGVLRARAAKAALLDSFESDGDVMVRNLAAIALAEIGDSDSLGPLLGGLDRKQPRALRGFSALALGILGDRRAVVPLRDLLDGRDERSLRAAAAVALGLLRDAGSAPRLRSIADDGARPGDERGYALVSLSMLDDVLTRNRVRGYARTVGDEDLRRAATLAIGVSNGIPAGRVLLASLFEETDPHVRGAAIGALALHPRRSVLEAVLTVVEARGFGADARKDAVAALGALALGGRSPALERLLSDLNYRSMSEALAEAAGLL